MSERLDLYTAGPGANTLATGGDKLANAFDPDRHIVRADNPLGTHAFPQAHLDGGPGLGEPCNGSVSPPRHLAPCGVVIAGSPGTVVRRISSLIVLRPSATRMQRLEAISRLCAAIEVCTALVWSRVCDSCTTRLAGKTAQVAALALLRWLGCCTSKLNPPIRLFALWPDLIGPRQSHVARRAAPESRCGRLFAELVAARPRANPPRRSVCCSATLALKMDHTSRQGMLEHLSEKRTNQHHRLAHVRAAADKVRVGNVPQQHDEVTVLPTGACHEFEATGQGAGARAGCGQLLADEPVALGAHDTRPPAARKTAWFKSSSRVSRESSQLIVPTGSKWTRLSKGESPNALADIAAVVRPEAVTLSPAVTSKLPADAGPQARIQITAKNARHELSIAGYSLYVCCIETQA